MLSRAPSETSRDALACWKNGWPKLSVVIPARNAGDTIPETIDGILAQDYPGELEVVVGDGSDDDKMARLLHSRYPFVMVARNPNRNTPAGLNRAIEASSGEIIARCDAHAVFGPGYLKRSVETMQRTGAAVVGGLQVPEGRTAFERAVGIAMTSVLGAGNSSHKIGGQEGPTDTVYLGVFRREPLAAAGCFDEAFIRNQDYELNWRLRRAGETVWLDPELTVDYQPRGSLRALSKQYFQYGWWKAIMLQRNPDSLRLRQLAAPVLVMGLLLSIALGLVAQSLWASALPLLYAGGLVVGSVYLWVRRGDVAAVLLPAALGSMHISWGVGFALSCVRMGIDKVRTGRTANERD